MVAPGEANWADCSTDTTTFTECADIYNGPNPQPIVAFGGTSESAPLTAGAAALVIQAYRDTHNGSTPSPALVKQIIMSTARDIDTRGADQGAGLVDALRAVQAARSYGNSAKIGDGLLFSPNAINVVSTPGRSKTTDVTVTNDGASSETLTPSVRALGTPSTIASGTLQLNQATDPTFIYQTGQTSRRRPHGQLHRAQAHTDRLHAAIAWQQSNAPARLPDGPVRSVRSARAGWSAQSRPQGPAGFVPEGSARTRSTTPSRALGRW